MIAPAPTDTDTSCALSTVNHSPHVALRDDTSVTGSHFGMYQILLVVRFVIDAVVSMRASSRVLNVFAQVDGRPAFDAPCHTTVQNFIVRIGLCASGFAFDREGVDSG